MKMPFIEIKGLPGKVYVPDRLPDTRKKNRCPDCFSCQACSESRCRLCLNNDRTLDADRCACESLSHEEKKCV